MSEILQMPLAETDILKPDNEVYENASLIVQTTNKCSKRCPGCYLANNPEFRKEELSQDRYLECINMLNENDVVALRGGEITLVQNWFERYALPALNKGLRIIIETNGYFIENRDYNEIMDRLKDDRIFIRVSFDLRHINNFRNEDIIAEFERMAKFAADAESAGINFGFYSLDMDGTQIQIFLTGTPLEPFITKFHSLTLHSRISDIKINGKYLKSNGNISDRIEPY